MANNNFPLKTPVRIVRIGNDPMKNATGIIFGKSIDEDKWGGVFPSTYIVLLDNPLPDALAVSITEACLERI